MKSVGYSTFYNENENENINNHIDLHNNQCLICLQGPIQTNNIIIDDVKLMNEMHFLIKDCNCKCYSHHKCIEQWIENNSVCPICKGPMSFPKSKIKEEIIQMPINVIEQPHEIIILKDTKPNNHYCIRSIFIILFLLIFISILTQ